MIKTNINPQITQMVKKDQNKGFVYNLRKSATSADKLFDEGKAKDEYPISNTEFPMMKVND